MLEERIIANETLSVKQGNFLKQVDLFLRLDVARKQDKGRQSELGQFFTPAPIARFIQRI
jgi:hypothetical protein